MANHRNPRTRGTARLASVCACAILFAAILPCASFCQAQPSAQPSTLVEKPLSQIRDNQLSRLGQSALSLNTVQWKHAETQNFVYHYADSYVAAPVAMEAEFYYRVIAKELGKDAAAWERKCQIFLFERPDDWKSFQKTASLDPWTGGIHSGGELFLLRDPSYKFKGRSLGHEITHLVIDRFFGSNVPLWINEGFAEYASTKAYASYMRARNYDAKPRSSAVPPEHYSPLRELTDAVSYPAKEESITAFYNQSHRLVRFLSAKDPAKFRDLLDRLSKGAHFESALSASFGAWYRDTDALEKEFRPYASKDHET